MDTQTTECKLVPVGWKIPSDLEVAIDRAWATQRASGDRESKQSLVARVLTAGLSQIAKRSRK